MTYLGERSEPPDKRASRASTFHDIPQVEGLKRTDQVKLLWDFRIHTDHILDHGKLEIVVLIKE